MRSLINDTVRPNALLFYIGFAALIISAMTKRVLVFGDIANDAYQVFLILLGLACLISIVRMPKKKMLLFILITILVVITRVITENNMLLSLWLLVVASRGIEFDNIIKFDLKLKIPLLIIVICCYFAGLTYVNLHYRDGVMRHSMGFSNPNVFSTYVMTIFAEILYLRRKKIGWIDVLLSIAAMLFIDYYADSRTQILCIVGLMLVFWLYYRAGSLKIKNSVLGKIIMFLNRNVFLILMVFSVVFAVTYKPSSGDLFQTINTVTSGRISAASKMLDNYDVTPFGQKVKLVYSEQAKKTGQEVQNLDNAYVYFLLEFGVIASLCMCYFMRRYMKHAEKERNVVGYVMMIYLIGGLMEHFCLEPQLNIFLLYFGQVAYDNYKLIKDQKKLAASSGKEK